jgi:DNA mismatch repair protein MutH
MAPPDDVRPPRTEDELLLRAQTLRGRSLAELAVRVGRPIPAEARRAKGFAGQLLEALLGATAASRSVPDFERIGVEMKSLPIGRSGTPAESTYVCTVDLIVDPALDWEHSRVRKKLARVLIIPIQGDTSIPLPDRRVGTPVLWSPSGEEEAQLRRDFDELMERVRLGEIDSITAHHGVALQIRPKGESGRAEAWGIDENGHRARVLPRGFYLRPSFMQAALARSLTARPSN